MADNNKLYYDTHAKNVIVDCKDGRDLESLIINGEIGSCTDTSETLFGALHMSTVPNMQNIENETYKYEFIGNINLSIGGIESTFYLYLRNIKKNEYTPVGTIIFTDFYNLVAVSALGGIWECLGRTELTVNEINKYYYAYKKIE